MSLELSNCAMLTLPMQSVNDEQFFSITFPSSSFGAVAALPTVTNEFRLR